MLVSSEICFYHFTTVSEIAKFLVQGCLLLFYIQELKLFTTIFVWILKSMHIILVVVSVSSTPNYNVRPHCNEWCHVVYCCFTRTTMLSELFTFIIRVIGPRMRRLPCGCYFIALHSNPFFSRPCAYNRLFSI